MGTSQATAPAGAAAAGGSLSHPRIIALRPQPRNSRENLERRAVHSHYSNGRT
jgi:hypothetical protein